MKKFSVVLAAFLLVALAVPLAVTGKAAPVEPATMETDEPAGKAVQEEGLAPLANPASDFTYTVANGKVTITGYTGKSLEAVIPAKIGGYPVTAIADKAFYARYTLTDIVLPDSVTSIGDYAFFNCHAPVAVPAGVTSIGEHAFDGCGMTSVTIPAGVTSLGDYAFTQCYRLSEVSFNAVNLSSSRAFDQAGGDDGVRVTFGKTVKQIPAYLFCGCSKLISAALPDSVTSIGEYAFYNCGSLTTVTIPDSVTSIGESAFYGCGMTSVTIPAGVTEIREGTFFGCEALTSATISAGVTSVGDDAFASCSSMTTVTIPASVTSIGDNAFYACSSLKSVTIPENVKAIGTNAFDSCYGLTEIVYNAVRVPDLTYWGVFKGAGSEAGQTSVRIGTAVERIPAYLFSGCSGLTTVTIPDNVTEIGDHAFYGCKNLTAVSLPQSVTTLKESLFSDCSSLTAVTIPDSVTSLETGIFSGCSSLTSITIPDSVTSLGTEIFVDCSSLTTVTLPDSVTSLGTGTFGNCSSLTSITIPDSVTDIGDYAFYRCVSLTAVENAAGVTSLGEGAFSGCGSLTAFTIPEGVTSIKNDTFRDCCSLNGITLPAGLTELGNMAFSNCRVLTSITIPKGVTTIGQFAFADCYELSSVTIRKGVREIGAYAFARCYALSEVVLPDGLTEIGEGAFVTGGVARLTLPVSLTVVDQRAFEHCFSLAEVYYGGRETEWLRVSVGERNSSLLSASFHFAEIPPIITEQPADQNVLTGSTAVFTVTAEGTHLTYQWQFSENGGGSWISCDPAEGAAASFQFTVSESLDGRLYRCVVTDEYGTVTTDAAKLTVLSAEGMPAFKSQSLVLSGEIGVNFYMDLSQLAGETRSASYVEFTVGKGEPVKAAFDANKTNSKGYFGFTCYVRSVEMADTITAVYHYGDGKTVTKDYSVERYIQAIEKNASGYDPRMVALARAIADYGHYAQSYLAQVNGWTVGDRFAEMSLHFTDEYDYENILSKVQVNAFIKEIYGSTITKATYKLHLDTDTVLDVLLTTSDGAAPTDVTVTTHDEETGKETTVKATPELDNQGRYLIRITGISAHRLGNMMTITGTAGTKFTIEVSPLSFVRSILSSDSQTEEAKDCVSSLYRYYEATMAYRGRG